LNNENCPSFSLTEQTQICYSNKRNVVAEYDQQKYDQQGVDSMELEKKGPHPRVNKGSSSQNPEQRDIIHGLWKKSDKGAEIQEDNLANQCTIENHILQNNRKITVPPSSIFGMTERDKAQKYYKEATERFISAYQSYEKTVGLLQKAKETGDLENIDYFTYFYIIDVNNLMDAINSMDQAKKQYKK